MNGIFLKIRCHIKGNLKKKHWAPEIIAQALKWESSSRFSFKRVNKAVWHWAGYSYNWAEHLLQLSWPTPTTELTYSYNWADLLLQLSWPSPTTELTYSYSLTELNYSYNCSDPTVLTYSYNCADLHLHLTYSWSFSNFLYESRLCSRVSPAQW
jgi:hypothetical protein